MRRAREEEEGPREGERACPAATEGWKEQAAAVPGTLLSVAFGTGGLLGAVAAAHSMLGAFVLALHMLVAGVRSSYIRDATRWRGRVGGGCGRTTPSAVLQAALRQLDRLAALHCSAGTACELYSTRAAVEDPLLKSWQAHRRDAVAHAGDARRMLRSAASIARASEDACVGVRSFRRGSPAWTARASAVKRFALNAAVGAALAQRALRRMHDAVVLEFYDTWRVLKG